MISFPDSAQVSPSGQLSCKGQQSGLSFESSRMKQASTPSDFVKRRNASVRPSGERAGHASPADPKDGEVRSRWLPVPKEISTSGALTDASKNCETTR